MENSVPVFDSSEQTESEIKTRKRKGILTILLAVIFFAGLIYLGIKSGNLSLILNKVQKKSGLGEIQSTKEPEAAWKKYSNSNLGVEMFVPGNFQILEKSDGEFVTMAEKIILFKTIQDPTVCDSDCPEIEKTETLTANGIQTKCLSGRWNESEEVIAQSFKSCVFSLQNKYLVMQIQELPFTASFEENRKVGKIPSEEISIFDQIVASLTLTK